MIELGSVSNVTNSGGGSVILENPVTSERRMR